MHAMIAAPGGWELVLIVLVILLLFGAKKLPELARGSGRALRIFKAETKGLVDDDQPEDTKSPEQREIEARNNEAHQAEARTEARTDAQHTGSADDAVTREQRDTTA